jgi:PAS domain S-box-containing protein
VAVKEKHVSQEKRKEVRFFQDVEDYAMVLLDRDGTIRSWNKGAQLINGYPADEAIGKSHRIFYSREDLDGHLPEKLLQQAHTTGKTNHEGWMVRRDGSRLWGSVHISAWREDAQSGFIMIIRDLTKSKVAEEQSTIRAQQLQESNEELRRSEDKYHKMISEIPDYAIILLDNEGTILDWNKGAERIKQYKASEIIGRNFRTFYTKEDREAKLPESLLEIARREGSLHREGWRVRKDGTRFWGSISIITLHDSQGEVLGFSKVTRDLTERKQVEDRLNSASEALRQSNEALIQSEERYHKMIAEVKDYAILMLDKEGKIMNWNAGAQQIKGYTSQEAIGKNFKIFYSSVDIEAGLPDRLLVIASTEGRALHEGWRIRKDGTRFWGHTVITALHNESGEQIGFSKVTRDLTQKKLAEDELKEKAFELDRNNKMLQRLNEDLASFNYVASHDLKEPLRKIQTFASLMERTEGMPERSVTFLQKIKNSAAKSYALIEDLLSFSRVSNDRSRFQMVDLNEIVTQTKDEFELVIRENNARVISDHLPVISGVLFQIKQLFDNLISNALKFSRERPVIEINYSLGEYQFPEGQPGETRMYHRISIVDNGVGFDQQYATRIFDPFQRLDSERKTSGSGIGLAIVKKVMENHSGWVEAEGRPDSGATFNIYFPAVSDVREPAMRDPAYSVHTDSIYR